MNLEYQPYAVAAAAIYLAGEMAAQPVGSSSAAHGEWWERFGVRSMEVENICHQLLDLYDRTKVADEPARGRFREWALRRYCLVPVLTVFLQQRCPIRNDRFSRLVPLLTPLRLWMDRLPRHRCQRSPLLPPK